MLDTQINNFTFTRNTFIVKNLKLSLFEELTKKLAQQYQADDIEQALSKLQSQNYQSDQRFANEFIQMRFNQGKGPIKIATDLKQRWAFSFVF
jgi:regulatory protein